MSQDNPQVSIIIPTYNRSSFLRRAIASILNQTFQDFELIIVDDCSTDDTEQVVADTNDHRIRYIKLKSNIGAPGARNAGIKSARSRYISFLDSDDEYMHNKLELQVQLLNKSSGDVGVIYSGYSIHYEPDIVHGVVSPIYKGNLFDILLKRNCVGSPTPLIKRECFDACGLFDESLPSCQDWDMWLRISRKYEFDFVNEPLAKTHNHGNQISNNIDSKILSREKLLEKYKSYIIKKPETASYHYQRLGFLHLLKQNSGRGKKYYLKSIAADPTDFRAYVVLFTSLISWKLHLRLMRGAGMREVNNITVYF